MAKRKYRAVTQKGLIKVEGMQEVLDNIAERLDRTVGKQVKAVYVEAAKAVWSKTKQNIAGLPASERLKQVLNAEVMINTGEDRQQNVLVGMSQQAGIRKLGNQAGTYRGKRFIPSPYWFEHGTAMRQGPRGSTGRIAATPFFRPAVTSTRGEMRDRMAAGFKELLVDR